MSQPMGRVLMAVVQSGAYQYRADYWVTAIGEPVKQADGTVVASIAVHIDPPRLVAPN